jgi:uncharacterized protein YdeI (YjbR/CyaY-like superfamily)
MRMVTKKRTAGPVAGPATDPKVDAAIGRAGPWKEAFGHLRALALGCGLAEQLKWGQPCYSLDGANIVLIHGFKGYCALLFMKGALMKDPQGLLVQQTAAVQSARQIRFTKAQDIVGQKGVLNAYLHEAMAVEKAGLAVKKRETKDVPVPAEFQDRLKRDPALKAAYQALTPGRQRAYLYHFAGAKLAQTRAARVDKCAPMILKGLGLDDV